MERQQEIIVAEALNLAIWLRDNVDQIHQEEVVTTIEKLGEYNIFSSRQLSAITRDKVSHGTISKLIHKGDKTGGNLNVGTLDILLAVLYSRATTETDYQLIDKAIAEGTSQGMVSKLTGVSQSSISRRKNDRANV